MFRAVILGLLFAHTALAGTDFGNGGDPYAYEFVSVAKDLVDEMKIKRLDELSGVRLTEFERMTREVRIVSRPEAILDGEAVFAINYPEKKTIVLSQTAWDGLANSPVRKRALVVHEYLGIMSLELNHYSVSRDFLTALTQPVHSTEADFCGRGAELMSKLAQLSKNGAVDVAGKMAEATGSMIQDLSREPSRVHFAKSSLIADFDSMMSPVVAVYPTVLQFAPYASAAKLLWAKCETTGKLAQYIDSATEAASLAPKALLKAVVLLRGVQDFARSSASEVAGFDRSSLQSRLGEVVDSLNAASVQLSRAHEYFALSAGAIAGKKLNARDLHNTIMLSDGAAGAKELTNLIENSAQTQRFLSIFVVWENRLEAELLLKQASQLSGREGEVRVVVWAKQSKELLEVIAKLPDGDRVVGTIGNVRGFTLNFKGRVSDVIAAEERVNLVRVLLAYVNAEVSFSDDRE